MCKNMKCCLNGCKIVFQWRFSKKSPLFPLSDLFFNSIYMNFISELRFFIDSILLLHNIEFVLCTFLVRSFSLSLTHSLAHSPIRPFEYFDVLCTRLFVQSPVLPFLANILLHSYVVFYSHLSSLGEYDRNMCVILKNELFPQFLILCWYSNAINKM